MLDIDLLIWKSILNKKCCKVSVFQNQSANQQLKYSLNANTNHFSAKSFAAAPV